MDNIRNSILNILTDFIRSELYYNNDKILATKTLLKQVQHRSELLIDELEKFIEHLNTLSETR